MHGKNKPEKKKEQKEELHGSNRESENCRDSTGGLREEVNKHSLEVGNELSARPRTKSSCRSLVLIRDLQEFNQKTHFRSHVVAVMEKLFQVGENPFLEALSPH